MKVNGKNVSSVKLNGSVICSGNIFINKKFYD